MKKNLLITILLLFLMIMNGVLLYLVVNKEEKRGGPPKDFIAKELKLDDSQLDKFKKVDELHHSKMRAMDFEARELKEVLFSNLGNSDFTTQKLDSVVNLISSLSAEREKEVFSYFNKLQEICNPNQQAKLNAIVSGALKQGPEGNGPPPPPER